MEVHAITPDDIVLPSRSSAGVTSIPADQIDATFKSDSIDLASSALGTKVLAFSDEWFAEASNLNNPKPAIFKPNTFVHSGQWYDGWETRRHNTRAFDWVIFRLGVASGRVKGVEVDTAFFNGNEAPEAGAEGCFISSEEEERKLLEDAKEAGEGQGGWETILSRQECGPSQRHAWRLAEETKARYTHIRLLMFPDGGIARFRVYGSVVPVLPTEAGAVWDLAATVNGGVAIACSDQHFGTKDNLLLPGRGVDMGDGWETKRTRGVHVDWAIIKFGAPGVVQKLVVDTAHFRGNFPQKVQVFAAETGDGSAPKHDDHDRWVQILTPTKTGPDKEHEYAGDQLVEVKGKTYAFVKLVIIPDGGVKRIRVFGTKGPA